MFVCPGVLDAGNECVFGVVVVADGAGAGELGVDGGASGSGCGVLSVVPAAHPLRSCLLSRALVGLVVLAWCLIVCDGRCATGS